MTPSPRLRMKPRRSHIFVKAKEGWYVEPAWCARRLFEVETFRGPIYDPAMGWGTILGEALRAGYTVQGSDIVQRENRWGLRCMRRDFLKWRGRIAGSVVVNPPFDHVQEFCEHALELGAAKVAVIMLVRRLNAAHWLQELPLQRVWLLTPRPSMPPGEWLAAGNVAGGGTQDFVWLVLERGYKGGARIDWLHRDRGPSPQ